MADPSRGSIAHRIVHLGLLVGSELDSTIRFYEALGLRLIHRNGQMAALQLRGGTHLVLQASDDPNDPNERTDAPFDLMVEDLSAYRRALIDAGLHPSSIEQLRNHQRFTIADPAGTEVHVYDSHVVGPA